VENCFRILGVGAVITNVGGTRVKFGEFINQWTKIVLSLEPFILSYAEEDPI
jgi:hypothetical protein